jgi:hypothetical protein
MWTTPNRKRYDRSRLRYPSDLTDDEWALVAPLIPPDKVGLLRCGPKLCDAFTPSGPCPPSQRRRSRGGPARHRTRLRQRTRPCEVFAGSQARRRRK